MNGAYGFESHPRLQLSLFKSVGLQPSFLSRHPQLGNIWEQLEREPLVQIHVQSPNSFLCAQCGSLLILLHPILYPNCNSQRAWRVKFNSEKTYESKRHREVDVHAKEFCLISPLPKAGENHFELLVSLPQHSGRSGNADRSQPPPSAWTSVTASTMRRPRIFTAVTSSERAAL